MSFEAEKDKIIAVVYQHYLKREDGDLYGDIEIEELERQSGLKSHVFRLVFPTLLKADIFTTNEVDQYLTFVNITPRGAYAHEFGGYTEKKRIQDKIAKRKKILLYAEKFIPITVSLLTALFTAGWTVSVFIMQRQSDNVIKQQQASIDSLTRAIKKITPLKITPLKDSK